MSNWFLTRERWPTEADFRRGIVTASRFSNGEWWIGGVTCHAFATVNFGSCAPYWAYTNTIAPQVAAAASGGTEHG